MITIIVEGDGEKRALPLIARRLSMPTVRCIDMKGKSNIVRQPRGFEDTIRRQVALGQRQFVILVDGDVFSAPYRALSDEQSGLRRRAEALAAELNINIVVCWAVLETESWLIGGLARGDTYCSLRNVPHTSTNSENSPADPKLWLKQYLNEDYGPRIQECLARHVNLVQAQARNRSFATFVACLAPDNENTL